MAQQAMIEETIKGMKRALARADDASESDDSIKRATNRGNKLKRKAKHVSEGRLAQADGPRVYKKRILYNGYSRYAINKRPHRLDADGDIRDDLEDFSDANLTPSEEDPFADVHIEDLLMPLISAADLDKHPTLSLPYKSIHLDAIEQDTRRLVQREQEALWRMKNLLIQFQGDPAWMPCGLLETEQDLQTLRWLNGDATPASAADAVSVDGTQLAANNISVAEDSMDDVIHTQEHGTAKKQTTTSDPSNWDEVMVDLREAAAGLEGQSGSNGSEKHPDVSAESKTISDEPNDAYDYLAVPAKVNGVGATALNGSNGTQEAEDSTEDLLVKSETVANGDVPADVSMTDGAQALERVISANSTEANQTKQPMSNERDTTIGSEEVERPTQHETKDYAVDIQNSADKDATDGAEEQPEDANKLSNGDESDTATTAATTDPPAHRMTTRAKAQATTNSEDTTPPHRGTSAPLSPTIAPTIHPFFVAPESTFPEANHGLQGPLAHDVRRLLCSYIQKQEHVVRQANELLQGLQRALLMRQTVWRWCRAEGHVGEMSDGEDWIDEEEWGLAPGELKKGEDVEDDAIAEVPGLAQTKGRRNRRAAA